MSTNSKEPSEKGIWNLLAETVQSVMKDRDWSLVQASINTGVNKNTIDRMSKGFTVEMDSIIQFAKAVAEKGKESANVRHYLKISGKENVVRLIEEAERAAGNVPVNINVLQPTGERIELLGIDNAPIAFTANRDNLTLIAYMMQALERARGEIR